ncbi:TonB-dependent receptor [Tumidithrix helvetica PCC 7403]|uniref:TonB-dependent receptor n=1 Tax=Tumidithrix helvetica TaxID=3457545 RepID=UPI003CA308E2
MRPNYFSLASLLVLVTMPQLWLFSQGAAIAQEPVTPVNQNPLPSKGSETLEPVKQDVIKPEPVIVVVPPADKIGNESKRSAAIAPVQRTLPPQSGQTLPTQTSQTEPSVQPAPATAKPKQPSLPASSLQILAPIPSTLDNGSTSVMVQFDIGMSVELRVNGAIVDEKLIGRTETNTSTNLVTQIWYGVILKEGENLIEVRDGAGKTAQVTVIVRGEALTMSLRSQEARIPADGRSTATIIGELTDKQGNRSNRNATITLSANNGEFVGIDADPSIPGFQVRAENGQFKTQLRSSLNPGNVTVQGLGSEKLEAFTQLQFESNLRPSIVTGVIDLRFGARGTDFYRSFRDFLPVDGSNQSQFDLTAAIFGTGRIGEWLITGAYNNTRPLNQDCNGQTRLFRDIQACDQSYPTYGDSSVTTAVTPSYGSLFLRLERTSPVARAGIDYIMWGDFKTEEFAASAQQFTAINRQLNGLKLNYNLGDLQITGFYSNTNRSFQRDNIVPDGTSGFYFLSRRLVQAGSESVFIELEELNRPGEVFQRTSLNRTTDYQIDYDRGTLLFNKPLSQTGFSDTGTIFVRKIVVSYEYETTASESNIYAGQLRYHFARDIGRETWVGANYFQENQGVRNFQLYGASAQVSLGDASKLIAEFARSDNFSDILGRVSGSAARVEIDGKIAEGITGRAFFRTADTGFTNNATISFVPGQTRFGAIVNAAVTPTTNLRASYEQETNRGLPPQPLDSLTDLLALRQNVLPVGAYVDNTLRTFAVGLQQRLGDVSLEVDLLQRDRQDNSVLTSSNSLFNSSSTQLRSRINVSIAPNLRFLLQNETSVSSTVDPIYQDRTVAGVDWTIFDGLTLRLAQQFFHNGTLAGRSITSADLVTDYKLGPDTTLTGRYTVLGGANLSTTQGSVGLNHRWTLSPGLFLNLGYERIFGDFTTQTAAGTQFLQPFAPGQTASTLTLQPGDNYKIGLEYTDNPDLKLSARYEYRTSSTGANTVISVAGLGKLSPALTVLLRYQQAGAANQLLTVNDTASLRIGLAYRDPANDNFNALLKYEYRSNPSTIPSALLVGTGSGYEDHVLSTEAIYAPNWQWEFYTKFAFRNSTSYLAQDFIGTSSILLGQLRATYRLGYNWDLVAEGRTISQPSAGYTETGFLAELGYYLTPNLRVAGGYSSGGVNIDRDFSGSRSAGGLYAAVTFKINELFDGFGLQKVAPAQPQESTTQVPALSATPAVTNPVAVNPVTANPDIANLPTTLPTVTKTSRPTNVVPIAGRLTSGAKQQMVVTANGAFATYSVATTVNR